MGMFTLLSKDQVFGKNKLNIIKKYGIDAEITDLISSAGINKKFYSSSITCHRYYIPYYWLKDIENGDTFSISSCSKIPKKICSTESTMEDRGIRPLVKYSLIKDSSKFISKINSRIICIEYGEFPQDCVSDNYNKLLDSNSLLKKNNKLIKTGKKYTLYHADECNCVLSNFKYINYKEITCEEYIFENNKFINFNNSWYQVRPIRWIVDIKNDIALSEKIIMTGVRFNYQYDFDFKFEDSEIKKYLDNVFEKEIQVNNAKNKEEDKEKKIVKVENYNVLRLNPKFKEMSDILKMDEQISDENSEMINQIQKTIYKEIENKTLINIEYLLGNAYEKDNRRSFFKSKSKIKLATLLSIKEEINKDNKTILEQVTCYENMKKYLRNYLTDIKKYINILKQSLEELDIKYKDVNELLDISDYTVLKTLFENKLEYLLNSIKINENHYLSLNQKIMSETYISNSLNFIKDVIIPLLLSENINKLDYNQNIKYESIAKELINVIHYLSSEDDKENIENVIIRLEKLDISKDTLLKIENGINNIKSTYVFPNNNEEEKVKVIHKL